MVSAIVLLGTFNSYYIADVLYYTNDLLLAHTVGANGTDIGISDIEAALAEFYLAPHTGNHFAEMLYFRNVLPEQMKYQAQCGLFAYPGQFGKFINGIFQ
jgi:hypothetical protein